MTFCKPKHSEKLFSAHSAESNFSFSETKFRDKYSRWMSCDPAVGDYMSQTEKGEGGIYNLANLNVYHYSNNNPLKYTDPNGEASFWDLFGGLGDSPDADMLNYMTETAPQTKDARTVEAAANGDARAQTTLGEASKAIAKEAGQKGAEALKGGADFMLEGVEHVADAVSEGAGIGSMVTSKVNPKLSAELGALSTGAAATATGAKFGRAAISGDPKDMQKAKDSLANTAASYGASAVGAKRGSVQGSVAGYIGSKTTNIVNHIARPSDASQRLRITTSQIPPTNNNRYAK